MESRDKAIKELTAKFIELVKSLEPGERLSIKRVPAKASSKSGARKKSGGKMTTRPKKDPAKK